MSVGKDDMTNWSLTPKEQAAEELRECLSTIAEIAAVLDTVRTYMDRQSPDVRATLMASREWQTLMRLSFSK